MRPAFHQQCDLRCKRIRYQPVHLANQLYRARKQPEPLGLESGNWGDHGLVFVTNKVDGKRAIVDDALSADGWMLDIDAYNYDVRNIAQNATVKGNVDALDDDDNPTPIAPGELTEQ